MSIQDEIYRWVKTFESWKQELFLRAAVSPRLSEDDVREVTSMLLGEEVKGAGPREVTREDLPGAEGADEPMRVHSLSELKNVNAIADGQALEFGADGLNVVFGKNGAGKTGYSRVLKHAGRTLHRESVLRNVAEPTAGGPSATVGISIGEEPHSIALDLEAPAPAMLGRICIADARAGEVYLTSDTEVDYAPATLASVRRLAEGLRAVDAELVERLEAAKPTELDLRPWGEDTEVRRLLSGLSARTPDRLIVSISTLSEEEEKARQDLQRKRGEIEAQQAPKLREAAQRDAEAAEQLNASMMQIAERLSPQKIDEHRSLLDAVAELQKAAELAAKELEGEPLKAVGSDPWRALWEAAREYAAHLGQQLPPDHEPAHCALCMQELGPEARERMQRFDEFVKSDINARLRDAERKLKESREALPDIETQRSRYADTLTRLGTAPEQPGHAASAWFDAAETIIARLRGGALDGISGTEPPPNEIAEWAKAHRAEAAGHAALEHAE
jgi:hypothetical protein